MVMSINEILLFWVDLGLYDVILPFLFIFVIVYMTLERTKILGEYKNVNAIVGFVFGFTVTASIQFVEGIQKMWSMIGLLSVAGVLLMILLGMFGVKSIFGDNKKFLSRLPSFLVLGIIAAIFGLIALNIFGLSDEVGKVFPFLRSLLNQVLITIIALCLIIWFIVREKRNEPSESSSSSSSKPETKTKTQSDSGDKHINSFTVDKDDPKLDSFNKVIK